jgi:acetyl/propionyl-CoA carboxylase alpha subunit
VKYFVTIGADERELELEGDSVTIGGGGDEIRARVEQLAGTPIQLVHVGDQVHRVIARRIGRGEYELTLDGYRLRVLALDERARAIRKLSAASARPQGPTHLAAPMPGLIVRMNANEGDHVRPGQGLVVMEAMKMENELRAAVAGVVRKVLVTPGSAVEKGAILLELDPLP